VNLAHQIYLRTGGGGSEIQPGNITIDAGKGEADLVTKSSQLFHYVGQSGQICHFFRGSADDATQKANYFSSNFTLLTGPLGVDGPAIVAGPVLANGSIYTNSGHIYTQQAASGSVFVLPCDGNCAGQIEEAIQKVREYVEQILPDTGDNVDASYLEGLWYEAKQAGNADVMDSMEFSFRTDDQYNIPDFVLFEDRWQQMARLANNVPERWTERAVTSKKAGETYPFPGKKWLAESDAFLTQDFSLVDFNGDGLVDKPRGSDGDLASEYAEPRFSSEQRTKINGQYPIVGVVK
jgi:hypothetical protein